jgi:NarL family two-component system sensor histidine kinase LiaS
VGLDFKMLSGHEHEISGWVRQLLIAATQELTRNAVKHGRATELEMHLRVSDDSVSFRVEDNGCGFDLQTALLSGRGLSSILNRAKDFGGTTSVLSRPGCSVILIQVPRLVV